MKKGLVLLSFLLVITIYAQKHQPKIGLVLSGGGAKGLAHIGVLEQIDASGLQIDYIGGTSMGAIVGGLYAAGYSAKQIKELVKQIDFTPLLQDEYPRNALPFFEKEFGEKHAFTLPVTKKGIQIPQAISKGQRVLDLFTYLLSPVREIPEFSDLPIPFFCIATNVENGEEVILEKGFLPLALRASGGFPTLLTPTDIDGVLLIDGGVANNFPVDVMKSKGMDYIIGVDVQSNLSKRENLNSAVSILNQIISYDVYRQREERLKLLDLYIHPDIKDFTVVDFDRGSKLIEKGQEAGKQYKKILDSLASTQKRKLTKKRTIKVSNKPFYVHNIQIKGNKNYTPAYIKGKLKIQLGDSLTFKELKKRMNFLTATENFERVDYTLEKKGNENHLIFNIIESQQKSNLRLGLHYDLLYESAALANYNHKGLFIKNDQLSIDAILGDNLRYNLNYFVDNGFYTSYGFRSRYNHFSTNTRNTTLDNVNAINLSYTDFTHEIFIQSRFNRKFAIGLGAELKSLKITTETVLDNGNEVTFDDSVYLNTHGYLKLDAFDDKFFPKKGFFADIDARWYMSSSDYNNNFTPFLQIDGTFSFATTFWNKLTFLYTSEGGFSFANPASNVFDFYLGGYNQNYINTFYRFYGYDFAELSGNSFVRSEFKLRYELFKNHYVNVLTNFARVEDNVFDDIDIFKNSFSGYAVGYSVDTFIGPLEIHYSWSPDTKAKFWLFNLGFWF